MLPRSQWRVPMRDKVGAEQLQQVPSLVNRPDGVVRSARTAPVGPTHGVAAATGTLVCGIGRMGLRCAMTMGKRRALLRSALAVSPRSSPTVSWPETEGGPLREPGGSAPVGCLGHGSNRWRHLGAPGCCARCAPGGGPERPRGEAGARGRTPDQEPNVLLTAAGSANVTAEAIHARRDHGSRVTQIRQGTRGRSSIMGARG
jgi:hypothetical protein